MALAGRQQLAPFARSDVYASALYRGENQVGGTKWRERGRGGNGGGDEIRNTGRGRERKRGQQRRGEKEREWRGGGAGRKRARESATSEQTYSRRSGTLIPHAAS